MYCAIIPGILISGGIYIIVKVANKMLMYSRLFSTGFVLRVVCGVCLASLHTVYKYASCHSSTAVMVCGFKYYNRLGF